MEELFDNFSQHIEHMISPKLGTEIKKYLRRTINSETPPEEYSKVENDIKIIMADYFQRASDKEYLEMATNLFNAYVENDDENLIRSVKYFIRIYSYFQNIKLKKKLYQWRINSLYKPSQSNNNNSNNNNVYLSKSNSGSKIVTKNNSVYEKLYREAKNKTNK